jgi:hypothetical protein
MGKSIAVLATFALVLSTFGIFFMQAVPVAQANGIGHDGHDGHNTCTPGTAMIYSDTSTKVNHDNSVAVDPNAAWTATIPVAAWIWSQPLDANGFAPAGTEVFTRDFHISGTPIDSSLTIAADNTYTVSVNGNAIASSTNDDNFSSSQVYDVPSADLHSGPNNITFTVTNLDGPGANPAGLDYALTTNWDCSHGETPTAPVVSSLLPTTGPTTGGTSVPRLA